MAEDEENNFQWLSRNVLNCVRGAHLVVALAAKKPPETKALVFIVRFSVGFGFFLYWFGIPVLDLNLLPSYKYDSPYIPQNTVPSNNDRYIYFNIEKPVRGRFEHSFFETGIAILGASGLGAMRGYIQGKESALGYPPKLRRVMLINHVVKRSKLGNMVGVLATVYAAAGIAVAMQRGKEDAANTLAAATITGFLFSLPGGIVKIMTGSLAGFSIGTFLAVLQVGKPW